MGDNGIEWAGMGDNESSLDEWDMGMGYDGI